MVADDIILFCSYPDSELKLKLLRDLVRSVRSTIPIPIALATHYPVPEDIIRSVDYFIYDADDRPGSNYIVSYHHTIPNDVRISTTRITPYHALSCLSSIKNGATFLRNKYRNLHYFEHDSIINFPQYLSIFKDKLKDAKFTGMLYDVPAQNIHAIVGNFYSFNIEWYDNNVPEIKTWDEYASYARKTGDDLLAEVWLWNYFTDHDLMRDCYFLTPQEQVDLKVKGDIKTVGDREPGLFAYLSELPDHRLILFTHLYCAEGRVLDVVINNNGIKENLRLSGVALFWKVIQKAGRISVESAEQSHVFDIDPAKEYTETTFKFKDDKLICLKEYQHLWV